MIGYASHQFNLASKEILAEDEDLLVRVNTLMGKLKNLILALKLRQLTNLVSKTRNDTRWSSTF